MDALNGLFKAMALHRLGRKEEARRLLATAATTINNGFDAGTLINAGGFVGSWDTWLFCRIALDEAKRVLEKN